MISNIKVQSVKNRFQEKISRVVPTIKQLPRVFACVCKTSNIYEMPEQRHKKLATSQKYIKKRYLNQKHESTQQNSPNSLTWMTLSSEQQEHLFLLHSKTINWTFNKINPNIHPLENELSKVSNLLIEKMNEKLISNFISINGGTPVAQF